jgi:hypothetical protein
MNQKTSFLVVFLGITALTAIVILAAVIGLFGEPVRNSDFSKWGIGAVLAEITIATVAVFKTTFKDSDMILTANIKFEGEKKIIQLDVDNCEYIIREDGRKIGGDKLQLQEGGSVNDENSGIVWQCRLPSLVKPNQAIELILKDTNGREWKVIPFSPFSCTRLARMK